jgi:phosphatidylglycerol:prolipoprotein diacylglycerol transferase
VQFPKDLYYAPPEVAQSVITQASEINPAWNSLPVVLDHVGQSSELRQILSEIVPPRHPSQIYEGLLEGVFLFGLMWIFRTRFRLPNGVLTGVFFIAYALLRILGEMFREPDAPLTAGFTRGQFLSLFMILMGVGFLAGSKWARTWPSQFRA